MIKSLAYNGKVFNVIFEKKVLWTKQALQGIDVFSKDWCQYNANDFLSDFLCVEVVPITNLAEVKTKARCFGTQKRPEMRENASVKEDTSSHKCL